MGGSTEREGRVEVCVDGHWGTVCNNSLEGVAEAVCSILGLPAQGTLPQDTVCLLRNHTSRPKPVNI